MSDDIDEYMQFIDHMTEAVNDGLEQWREDNGPVRTDWMVAFCRVIEEEAKDS